MMSTPRWKKLMLAASLAVLPACGMEGATSPESQGFDPKSPTELGQTRAGLNLGTETTWLPARGDYGGVAGGIACPANSVAVGIQGTLSAYLNSIGLVCRTLNADGTLGATSSTAVAGSQWGSFFSLQCPDGMAIVGFPGHTGWYVDSLGLYCAAPNAWMSSATVQSTVAETGSPYSNPFSDVCPQQQVVTQLAVRNGNVLDQEQALCTRMVAGLPASFLTNVSGPWSATAGSTWTEPAGGGKQGTAGGDGFLLSTQTGSNFTYEGDVRVVSGVAAALTFRASADASQHYTVNVHAGLGVKLWRPGRDVAVYPTSIVAGQTYHLKVVANGSRFLVYLDNGTAPVIDTTDTAYASGLFGLNVYAGTGLFQNVNVSLTNVAGPWSATAGSTWTEPVGGGKQGTAGGDGFLLSAQTGSNFTYEGDVRVVSGVAAALTFRASADASQHYTVNVHAGLGVKLWRPGRDVAVYPTSIVTGQTYHLKVVANGSRFLVYLDNGTAPVIDATDTAYASGLFGLNVYASTGLFQNVNVSPLP
ncbi:hypothetical protein [Vitiosangium sp. GDMCC 1.1324]|uniref:hypothetical protein n=1 Tax=Vitiosangium sp. (strain GDMCC 1.1324) TaxID=2138576 RepID=UPI0018EE91DA|nr:hypothetical protein [Vitiosangium sp. GDMCC 1.1324]